MGEGGLEGVREGGVSSGLCCSFPFFSPKSATVLD